MAALTAEEWRFAQSAGFPRIDITVTGAHGTRLELHGPPLGLRDHAQHEQAKVHQIAALALHGQPFGFTWHDVDMLESEGQVAETSGPAREWADLWLDLAQRIAALLPPRE